MMMSMFTDMWLGEDVLLPKTVACLKCPWNALHCDSGGQVDGSNKDEDEEYGNQENQDCVMMMIIY